ncbi:hypothetical protein M3Y98_00938400 [Aphelenchoides besseyi]|nr:hypothetical protein M3Y98_00938400 [Aphelenchoides besseyi]KAI6194291.1 hypothetical protein M3Y96_01109500 [Aphelenchoides besseyi]
MWNSDNWKRFLQKECVDYPGKAIAADAEFLAEQDLGPSQFNTLIEIYERDSLHSFKKNFPSFNIGNLLRFIDGLKSYVREKEGSPKKTVGLAAEYSGGPPAKKVRFDQSAPNVKWFDEVKKYMLYFVREGDEENYRRRCACAISPTIAVTFAHGRNKGFKARIANKDRLIEQGSILKLYSLYNSQNQQDIRAEVVWVNRSADFILLEALEGKTFFGGKEDGHILEDPAIGTKLLAIGLSSDTPSQEAVTTGVVLSTGPFDNHQMVSDIIAWGGDSGGGLFSPANKLLGIVSASQESDEGEWTRTYFAPATEIRAAWDIWMVESGKKAKRKRLGRSEE